MNIQINQKKKYNIIFNNIYFEQIIVYRSDPAYDSLIETLEGLKDESNKTLINDVIHCIYSMGAFFTLKAIESFNITDSVLYDTIDGELRSYCDDSAITSIDRCCQKLRKLIKLLSEYIY